MTPGRDADDAAAGTDGQDRDRDGSAAASSPPTPGRSSGARRCASAAPTSDRRPPFTDAQGRYEFRDLPAGRFNVSVSKSGFVTMQYGQTRPFEPGRPIDLADAQVMEKADVALPRGSAVSGRILDEFGEPVADATVAGDAHAVFDAASAGWSPTGRASTTNDLGQFRLFGLPPGEYYVSVNGPLVRHHVHGHVRRRRRRPDGIEQQLRLRRHLLSRHAESRRGAADHR